MKKVLGVLFFLSIFLLFSFIVNAANNSDVVINEIAWMGTTASANDEWIELYNNSNSTLDLENWQLVSEDGTPKINLKNKIPPRGFFLLERTNDETITTIKADLIYKGALHNQGEHLKLYNNSGNLIDQVNCSEGWFAGNNETKQTMERTNSGSWTDSKNPGGTPKEENSPKPVEPTEVGPLSTEPVSYPAGIIFNEILPSPEGADAENEWIELFNKNNFEVDVSEWQIRDKVGAIKIYTIPNGTKIESNDFLVLSRPKTKITLQNSGDSLELLSPDNKVVHQITYGKAPLGQSFNRSSEKWDWSATLTPGESNIITGPEIYKTESLKISEEKEDQTKYPQSIEEEELLTAKIRTSLRENLEMLRIIRTSLRENLDSSLRSEIGEVSPESLNPLIIFLIATTIAIFSGIIVLFLKKKTEETE